MSELQEFKCPNCSGKLEFDAKTQKLKCPFCDGTFDPEIFDESNHFTVDVDEWNDEDMVVYSCNSCGGELITDKTTAATSCPYCGSPVVMTGNVSGIYRPKKIIPFAYDRKQAISKYQEFLKGKKLLPKAFKDQATINEIKGVYVPYWLFDGTANARMTFNATKTRMWADHDYNYTETSYYRIFRSGSVGFENVPVDASSKIADELTESIEPFDSRDSKSFSENYLAGFVADKYDVDVEESRTRANARIANSTESLFESTVRMYDSVVPTSSSIAISKGEQKYVMFPVWLLNVKYLGETYTFAMNGQTGKFVGELPSDRAILFRHLLLTFVIVLVVLSLIQYLVIMVG